MNTVDLVKAAENRKYNQFEDLALELLKQKVQENPATKAFELDLAQARGLSEADMKGEEGEEDEEEEDEKDEEDEEDED